MRCSFPTTAESEAWRSPGANPKTRRLQEKPFSAVAQGSTWRRQSGLNVVFPRCNSGRLSAVVSKAVSMLQFLKYVLECLYKNILSLASFKVIMASDLGRRVVPSKYSLDHKLLRRVALARRHCASLPLRPARTPAQRGREATEETGLRRSQKCPKYGIRESCCFLQRAVRGLPSQHFLAPPQNERRQELALRQQSESGALATPASTRQVMGHHLGLHI